ncbi:hypothetical protein J5J01_14865 [Streptomyces fradiae]|uniref:hypothetical protein n=1 Tax=Streptomyces fradiae TaxID=1906 RepID=UPI0020194403|nr:hypothetical protein [Streptomyces fradiae]UQS28381.1 hypothetical protein J5J01_14865 [Streptomyces fradiae]
MSARRTELVDLPVSFGRPVRLFACIVGHSHNWRAFILEPGPDSGPGNGPGPGNGHVVAGGVFWAESSAPVGHSSFLAPAYDLPRFHPDRPVPPEPPLVRTAYPRR